MSYTADIIQLLSSTSPKVGTSDSVPAFYTGRFSTYNWNCAATAEIRRFCENLFDEYTEVDWAKYPDCYLSGDISFDEFAWFDWEHNVADFGVHINGYDVVAFRFQDSTFVFFFGSDDVTYFVQWFKNRGRTEWICSMEGENMETADPITAEEYADLLNQVCVPCTTSPLKRLRNVDYAFWHMDRLEDEAKKCERDSNDF